MYLTMKTASKLLLPIIGLFYLLQCSSNEISNSTIISKNNISNYAMIDYTRDTLFYIFKELKADTFMITHTLWLKDSCFGSYNDENWQSINKYRTENLGIGEVNVTYHIACLKEGIPVNVWNIGNARHTGQIRLELGYGDTYRKLNNDNIFFLKIILKTNYESLSQISLNYELDEGLNLIYLYKERIHIKKLNHLDTRKVGYCLDTVHILDQEYFEWYEMTGDNYDWQVCE